MRGRRSELDLKTLAVLFNSASSRSSSLPMRAIKAKTTQIRERISMKPVLFLLASGGAPKCL
jgi:hypothetical protein